MNEKWSRYFIHVAQQTAQLSYAQRLKVGAVAVRNKRIILCGYNGTPAGWNNQCEDAHGQTFDYVLHAEENLILYAAQQGISLRDSDLYITHSPCIQCAKLIYGAGIQTVTFLHRYRKDDGIHFLQNCSIQITQYDEE